jgi:hypothetical protein
MWLKGQSGNPNGRTRGSKNKATAMAMKLLDGESEELARKAIELAKGGDVMCLSLDNSSKTVKNMLNYD